jgi:hypothetical protein
VYFFDGFVYGGEPKGIIRVEKVKPLPDQMMLLTFNNHEQRLFDATILNGPAFEPLSKQRCSITLKSIMALLPGMKGRLIVHQSICMSTVMNMH